MSDSEPKATLQRYLQLAREAMVWKLDGLSDYDVRRPLVPTGTNLLGLVKHLASVEIGYFGVTFDRPFPEELPWLDDPDGNADLWARPEESRDFVVGLYRAVWVHADETIESRDLDAPGHVPWWGEHGDCTLHDILVHVIAETNRHVGHADIVRELIDGAAGLRADNDNLASDDGAAWAAHHARVESAARRFQT